MFKFSDKEQYYDFEALNKEAIDVLIEDKKHPVKLVAKDKNIMLTCCHIVKLVRSIQLIIFQPTTFVQTNII